jgi:SAM-dependent methyltransferase
VRDFSRVYARQEYLTPGAAETVEIIAETVQPTETSLLLDVACGKGEAAATLAGRFACRIAAVEMFDSFIHHTAAKAWFYNLRDLITVLRGDGRRLPVRDGAFDAAYCIGAPSIVGLEACLQELARTTKPDGHVIVLDIVWRAKPAEPLGEEWRWLARTAPISPGEYAAAIEGAGFRVQRTHIHDRTVWEEYWGPMLQVAQEAQTLRPGSLHGGPAGQASQPADVSFADDITSAVALERRAVDEHIDYATFVARKPGSDP